MHLEVAYQIGTSFFMVKENSNKLPMYTQNNINALLIEFTAELLNNTQLNT